jgi:hypothetical protein
VRARLRPAQRLWFAESPAGNNNLTVQIPGLDEAAARLEPWLQAEVRVKGVVTGRDSSRRQLIALRIRFRGRGIWSRPIRCRRSRILLACRRGPRG